MRKTLKRYVLSTIALSMNKVIENLIEPTVYVLDRLKPIYNFKSEN